MSEVENSQGLLISIEGIDGSGKGTQAKLLTQYLDRRSIPAELFSFPRYEKTFFGKEVGKYLNGEFGSLQDIHPKLAATLYAGDRFETKRLLESGLEEQRILICDRYVGSNVAHQSAKLPLSQRSSMQRWINELEYEVFELPKPNIVIFLDVPPKQATILVEQKSKRLYTDKSRDLHEASPNYLEAVYSTYLTVAREEKWIMIDCFSELGLRSPREISDEIISLLIHEVPEFVF